jgi:hypothetical protein
MTLKLVPVYREIKFHGNIRLLSKLGAFTKASNESDQSKLGKFPASCQ